MQKLKEEQVQISKLFNSESLSIKMETTSCTIYLKDYCSLLPLKWLTTEAIDLLLKLIYEDYILSLTKTISYLKNCQIQKRDYGRVMDVFVSTMIMMNDDEVILGTLEGLGLFSEKTKYWLVASNTQFQKGQHWLLLLFKNGRYDGTTSQIVTFDSANSKSSSTKLFASRLSKMHQMFHHQQLQIKIRNAENIVYQDNTFDCGIYTLGFCEYILEQIINGLDAGINKDQFFRLNQQYKHILSHPQKNRERYRNRIIKQLKRYSQ